NDAPPQAIAEEAAGALEISDAQTDVIDAACGGCGVLCHGILLLCADDIVGCAQRPRKEMSLPRTGRLNAAPTRAARSYRLIHRRLTGCRLNKRSLGPSLAGD